MAYRRGESERPEQTLGLLTGGVRNPDNKFSEPLF